MKVETPQILWNGEGDKNVNAALLSVAVLSCGNSGHGAPFSSAATSTNHSSSSMMILATAGNSSVVNLWAVSPPPPSTAATTRTDATTATTANNNNKSNTSTNNVLSFRCSLGRQDGACNCVRFSPNGVHLAGASEHGAVVVWSVPSPSSASAALATSSNNNNHTIGHGHVPPGVAKYWFQEVGREQDLQFRVAARTGGAVMDVAWNADSTRIVAGSVDHTVIVCEYSGDLDAWKVVYRHDDHTHFVQGVAFDPLHVYVASMSSDRTVRVHGRKKPAVPKKGRKGSLTSSSGSSSTVLASTTKTNADAGAGSTTTPTTTQGGAATGSIVPAVAVTAAAATVVDTRKLEMTKSKLIKYHRTTTPTAAAAALADPTLESQPQPPPQQQPAHKHLFQDEATLESFVRRLAFTADGAYLITPAAQWGWQQQRRRVASGGPPIDVDDNNNNNNDPRASGESPPATSNATLLFARHKWDEPCRVLTGMQKPSVAVRPCPVLFRLPETTKENLTSGGLPYRSVFCVLTWDTVLIYDTYHAHPLAVVSGLHYCNLVDAAWSSDGRTLFVCSTDGYVSIVQFDEGELGQVYVPPARTALATTTTSSVPVTSRVGTGAENDAEMGPSGRTTDPAPKQQVGVRSPVPSAGPPTLPPCEPGLTSLEAPPSKRAKLLQTPEASGTVSTVPMPPPTTTTEIGMDQLTIHEPKAKKKRIQPTFIAATN